MVRREQRGPLIGRERTGHVLMTGSHFVPKGIRSNSPIWTFNNNDRIQRLIFWESQLYHKVQKVEELNCT